MTDGHAVGKGHLAVVSRAEWVSVLTSSACKISGTNDNWLRIFVDDFAVVSSLVRAGHLLISGAGWDHVSDYGLVLTDVAVIKPALVG